MAYWEERLAKSQDVLSQKNRKQLERILRKQYRTVADGIIKDFEATYNKILASVEAGRQPTPADLYKLDSYWQMQAQVDKELKQLNERQQRRLLKTFRQNYKDIYESISVKGLEAYSSIDTDSMMYVINQIWCTDGKSWSQRIWENTALLKETLNEELVQCVVSGKPPAKLKQLLMERFNVSYGRADTLVRTELAHIQTEAAKQRYRDLGVTEVKILADKDERQCEHCGKLHGKVCSINEPLPIPAHPKCRCCIVPIVK